MRSTYSWYLNSVVMFLCSAAWVLLLCRGSVPVWKVDGWRGRLSAKVLSIASVITVHAKHFTSCVYSRAVKGSILTASAVMGSAIMITSCQCIWPQIQSVFVNAVHLMSRALCCPFVVLCGFLGGLGGRELFGTAGIDVIGMLQYITVLTDKNNFILLATIIVRWKWSIFFVVFKR